MKCKQTGLFWVELDGRRWCVILVIVGLIGLSFANPDLSVEDMNLDEEFVAYSEGSHDWKLRIGIGDVCGGCSVEINSISIEVDGVVVHQQERSSTQPIVVLSESSWRVQQWQYSVGSGFNSIELDVDLSLSGEWGSSWGWYWNVDVGLVNDNLSISRVMNLDVTQDVYGVIHQHAFTWIGGDREIDSDGDGFTEVGATYSGDCESEIYGNCVVRALSDDVFPSNPTQSTDRDGDGYGDNSSGAMGDAFPDNPLQWNDLDGDGYGDNWVYNGGSDACVNEWGNSTLDRLGCLDSDGDGWSDGYDECPDVWGNSTSDRVGCVDSDGDQYSDEMDEFPNNPMEIRDRDGDGVGDNADAFPDYELEWLDSDGDGQGDNSDWDIYDRYEWVDSDGDGVGDNADAFPEDSRRSAEGDMLEPGQQFFLVVVGLLTAILILFPKGIEEFNEVDVD